MKEVFPRIRLMGERAVLIEFEPEIGEEVLEKVLFFKKKISAYNLKEEDEVITTYNSLLVYYNGVIEDIYSEVSALKSLLKNCEQTAQTAGHLFHIPVCYDKEFGPDLEEISVNKNLSVEQIIDLHSAPVYTVYFTGFLPGFLYLGGLDKRLHISRKNGPRLEVQKGSVGIGENQTGIYPQTSPGGWQLIGNSPVPLFDKNKVPPCEISAGDKVKFEPVGRDEFGRISEEIRIGKFQLKKEIYEI